MVFVCWIGYGNIDFKGRRANVSLNIIAEFLQIDSNEIGNACGRRGNMIPHVIREDRCTMLCEKEEAL